MKSSKQPLPKAGKQPVPSSPIKHALLGLFGIVGLSISMFGPFKVPFAEAHAKEHWRHALAGIVILLALAAAIVGLAIFMFDANYFKSQMVDYVKEHNQRDLTLEGDIKVTFFPQLGLDAEKVTLSQRNSGKAFASIENTRLYVAWWPLLLKQLQIKRVALDGVHANIIRYKNGTTNLDDLLASKDGLGDIKFEIDSIKLKNSSINLQDESAGLLFALHDMDVETGKLTDSTPGDITASFRLESTNPRIDTKVKLNSHIFFELKTKHYELANFEGEMEGEALGVNSLALSFQGTVNSYPATDTLVIDKFIASAKGKVENRKFDAKLDVPKIQVIKGTLNGSTLNFNTSLVQDEESLTTSVEIPAFAINDKLLSSENITANLDLFSKGRTLQAKFNSPFSYNFETRQLQLPTLVSNLTGNHPLLASKLSGNASGNLQINFAEKNLKLGFKSKIDDSNITGNLGIQDFVHPAYTFDLAVNKLDLDHCLATDWAKRFRDDALPFDFGGLKELNLRGKLRSNELTFAKLKVSNLVAEFKAEKSTLLIEPLNARLYGGSLTGSIGITALDTPRIAFKQKLYGVQIHDMFTDILPGESKIAGKGNLTLDLSASGNNMGSLRKSLSGDISLALGRGSLAGSNLTEALLAGKSQLGLKDAQHSDAAKFTDSSSFSELKATFAVSEGKAQNTDFLMKSPFFTSKGEGEITLDSGQLNYRFNTIVSANLKRNSGEIAELRGINIPMRVTGPYATPTVIFDFGKATGGYLSQSVKQTKPKTIKAIAAPAGKSKATPKK